MSSSGKPSEGSPRWQAPLRALLLGAAFLLPLVIMGGKSATFDEVAHLPAGYSYWKTHDIRINPQHPPLIKELCALPLLFLDVVMPVDAATLAKSPVPLTFQWGFGKRFLYTQDADRILFWGRVPAVLLSFGLAALVMIWAGRLWGRGAALVALFLYVFDPTVTAHAQLVTTDVGLAFFATLFLFALRRALDSPSMPRLILSGAALGLALGAKFSAVLLIPIAALLAGMAAWRGASGSTPVPGRAKKRAGGARGAASAPKPGSAGTLPGGTPLGRVLVALGGVAAMTAVAFLVVWALYFFPRDPLFYVKGYQTVNRDHDPNYLPYLLGELRPGGWRSYLLIAYLVKTPIPTLLILAASAVVFLRGRRAAFIDEAFLIVPGLAFFAGYSLTADNLGVRYLIPCFPFFFIFASRIAPAAAAGTRLAKGVLAAALVWILVEFGAIWPDHLSYFNEVTGIPPRGTEWLDDSNVDWGQGLIQLRDYLAEHPMEGYRFCYFGSGDPSYYRIQGAPISVRALASPPPPGSYILSAHCVARARAELARLYGEGAGNWLSHRQPAALVGHAYHIYEIH